jgi:hypothetical protein
MAEVTAMRNNALPYPVYGLPYVVAFPILDADGDLVTGASGLDSEISKNGDTFADCTNEATEMATSSGTYYLSLTGTELTADVVTIIVKTSTSGGKTTTLTLYPRKLVSLRTGTCQGGAAGYMTLDASAGAADDLWNGCIVAGVLDSATEVRVITDYTGSNQQAAVTPNWNTTPDSDDTFTIYLPEGRQLPQANTTHLAGTSQTARDIGASVLLSSGTGTGQVTLTSGRVNADITHIATAAVNTSSAQIGVNVVNYGGSAGSFSGGRPQVNVTHIAGTISPATAGYVGIDWAQISGKTTTNALTGTTIASTQKVDVETIKTNPVVNAGTVTFPTGATLASTTNITAGTITTVTNLTNAPTSGDLTATMKTSVQTAATASLNAYDPPTNTEMVAAFTEIKGATWASTDTLEAIRDQIGTAGAGLTAIPWNASWDTEVQSECADALTAAALTAAGIADAVWDEAISGHSGSGSTGEALAAAGGAGDPWITALPGSYTAGQAGYIVGTNLNATVGSRATQTSVDTIDGIVDDILVDTAVIGAAGAGLTALATAANLATVDTVVDAIKVKTDYLPSATMGTTGGIAGHATLETVATYVATIEDAVTTTGVVLADGSVDADALATSAVSEIVAGMSIGSPGGVAGQNTLSGVSTQIGTNGVNLSNIPLPSATCNKIADHVRRRTQANVEASSDGDTLGYFSEYGMIQQAQESNTVDNAGKLTVYKTDGTTELAQRTLTTDDTAEPITGIE